MSETELEPARLTTWQKNLARWCAVQIALKTRVTKADIQAKATDLAARRVSGKEIKLLRRDERWKAAYQEAQTKFVDKIEADARASLRSTAPLAVKVYRKALGALHKELGSAEATDRMSAARSAAPLLNIGIDRLSPRKTEHAITQTSVTITLTSEQQRQIAAPEILVEAEEVEIIHDEETKT